MKQVEDDGSVGGTGVSSNTQGASPGKPADNKFLGIAAIVVAIVIFVIFFK